MIRLRDYQEDGVAQLYTKMRTNKRLVFWMQMGGGKSEIAAYITQEAVKDGVPVVMVVRGRNLVRNLSERLDKYKVDHSVFMSGHYRFNKSKLVQVVSIDTMNARSIYPYSDTNCIVIVDEAHLDYSKVYQNYSHQWIIGLTATPFSDMSMYEDHVCPIEPYELRDMGALVPERIYCPHVMDTSSLNIVAGDFKRDQVAQLVTQGEIVNTVIKDYIDLGGNRPAVCFAVNIEHSKQLRDEFIANGIPSMHCDASSSDNERKQAKEGLENGSIKVLCNVDIFSVGWDCPIVSCIILARPTWSLIWYLQAVGRGLRSFPGKSDCIILDNAGNVFRHGTPYRPRDISLEKPSKRKKKDYTEDETIRTCQECYFIYEAKNITCPQCGALPPKREIKLIEGILSEYSETPEDARARRIKEAQQAFYKLQWVAQKNRLTNDWIRNQISKKYGSETLPYIDHLFRIKSR